MKLRNLVGNIRKPVDVNFVLIRKQSQWWSLLKRNFLSTNEENMENVTVISVKSILWTEFCMLNTNNRVIRTRLGPVINAIKSLRPQISWRPINDKVIMNSACIIVASQDARKLLLYVKIKSSMSWKRILNWLNKLFTSRTEATSIN
jgi:hypothetical protein